jgi:hypothetical protein
MIFDPGYVDFVVLKVILENLYPVWIWQTKYLFNLFPRVGVHDESGQILTIVCNTKKPAFFHFILLTTPYSTKPCVRNTLNFHWWRGWDWLAAQLAERVGLSRPLCGLLADWRLRRCVGRTGFSSATALGKHTKKDP